MGPGAGQAGTGRAEQGFALVHQTAGDHATARPAAVCAVGTAPVPTDGIEEFVHEVVAAFVERVAHERQPILAGRDGYLALVTCTTGDSMSGTDPSLAELVGLLAEHIAPAWRMGFSANQVAVPSVNRTLGRSTVRRWPIGEYRLA